MKSRNILLGIIGIVVLVGGYFVNTAPRIVDFFRDTPLDTSSYKKIQEKVQEEIPAFKLRFIYTYGCVRKYATSNCWGIWKDEQNIFYNVFSRWYMSVLHVSLEDIVIKEIGPEMPKNKSGTNIITESVSVNTEYQIVFGSGIDWVKEYIRVLGN